MKKTLKATYEELISVENLLLAWREFVCGKKTKPDVVEFSRYLMDNILDLHQDLLKKSYRHGGYYKFKISDPKPRDISKASVRDRLLHHAIYRILYPFFDSTFISDSFSCRNAKGTHKAIDRLQRMFYQVSQNNTRTVWALKLDVRKFFASIDHGIMIEILNEYIPDRDITGLLDEIIRSFPIGLPLGNLTSQLFVNIYMNQFDQFVKHELKIKYYVRYADDFVLLSHDRDLLINQRARIQQFLQTRLRLDLHPDKIILKTFSSGVDFLGWVNFPRHRVLRTKTKRRVMKKIRRYPSLAALQSYLGLISHGESFRLRELILNEYFLENSI